MTEAQIREIEEHVIEVEREVFNLFDPRHLIEEWFRVLDGVLAAQRRFVLRVVDAMDVSP